MPFCQSCGAQVEGRFCGSCGASVGSSDAPVPAASPGAPHGATAAGMTDNVASALCYVLGLLTGILFLVLEPYNRNKTIRFHAFQSIFLSVGLLIVFWGVLPALAVVTGGFIWFVAPLISLGSLVLWVFLIWKAYQNERFMIPVIGEMAQKQA
ncbi:MAG: hypothetical protein IPM24_15100 [Bryobacterales bacterium]|jgi:uncharacterized membrane protein|nr:hypothetical protein [Bryobacterales bacterium]